MPGGQSSQETLPEKAEKLPTVQFAQASSRPLPPSLTPLMPLGQYFAHVPWPGRLLKAPSSQGSHVALENAPVTAEAVPGGHREQAVAPVDENVPEGHVKHAALVMEPIAELLVPWGQGVQALASVLSRLLP